MGILDYFRKKKVDSIVDKVNKKNIGKRYFMLILGTLIVAFSFNLLRKGHTRWTCPFSVL